MTTLNLMNNSRLAVEGKEREHGFAAGATLALSCSANGYAWSAEVRLTRGEVDTLRDTLRPHGVTTTDPESEHSATREALLASLGCASGSETNSDLARRLAAVLGNALRHSAQDREALTLRVAEMRALESRLNEIETRLKSHSALRRLTALEAIDVLLGQRKALEAALAGVP